MRTVIFTVVLVTAAIAVDAQPCTAVTVRDGHELWIDGRKIIRDEFGVDTPRWSPDGRQIAYVNDFELSGDPVSHIVVIDRAGHVRHSVPVPESAMFGAVLDMGWRNPTTVWVNGHVNPSSGIYEEFDVATGEMKNELLGAFFSPSPDGRLVAYRAQEGHPPNPHYHAPLMLNEQKVKLGDNVVVTGPLVWSQGSLAAGIHTDGSAAIAFIGRGARVERVVPLPAKGRVAAIEWAANDAVVVVTDAGDTWRVTRAGAVDASDVHVHAATRDDPCRGVAAQ